MLISPAASTLENEFCIGICAADHAAKLGDLLDIINHEPYPEGFVLKSVIIVGSGLTSEASSGLRDLARDSPNFIVIEEPVRKGKAYAINRVVEKFTGSFLVLINSDALPEQGAIARLLCVIASNGNVGMVSASPVVPEVPGITGAILRLMWGVHNECLLTLNHGGLNNHCCDELLVLRSDAVRRLPPDTVNDGAFLAGSAYGDGYSIKFSQTAHVMIDVPRRISDLIRQRGRILYGHFQIRRALGRSPRTMESMLVGDPRLSLYILIRTIRKFPSCMLALPIAAVAEAVSMIIAITDTMSAKANHVPWTRVGSKS